MIERYSLPRMSAIWSDEHKMEQWLKIEVLACGAYAELGLVDEDALAEIKEKATFNVERVKEIEKETRHDVVAFINNLSENIGPASRYIHFGLTSSDVLDTGMALQMREAVDLLISEVSGLVGLLKRRAFEFRDTVMVGRTHGVHAEPTTFGLKLALWAFETRRNLDRLIRARSIMSYGKISGAVGTYGSVNPFVERYVLERLGLKVAEASSQILQRDRHAEYMCALAITAASLEKFATELRSLQRTELLEAEEPFLAGQTGSSAMPHKRNPILGERICGLARVIKSNSMVALNNVALWHERDISHSSAERIIIPDSTILLDYILDRFTWVVEGLKVYPERMKENLGKTGDLIFSEKVLLKLIEKGVGRQEAYRVVQRNALDAWQGKENFRSLLEGDEDIKGVLTPEEIESCFDLGESLKNAHVIFDRLEFLEAEP